MIDLDDMYKLRLSVRLCDYDSISSLFLAIYHVIGLDKTICTSMQTTEGLAENYNHASYQETRRHDDTKEKKKAHYMIVLSCYRKNPPLVCHPFAVFSVQGKYPCPMNSS